MQKRAPSLTKAEKAERANKAAWNSFVVGWTWLAYEVVHQATKEAK